MSRTTLHIVIALMSIALLGIIGLQAYWLRQAMVLNNRNFNAAVNDALDQVALRLEQEEMDHFFYMASQGMKLEIQNGTVFFGEGQDSTSEEGVYEENMHVRVEASFDDRDTLWVKKMERHESGGNITQQLDTFEFHSKEQLGQSPRMVQILTRTLRGAASPQLSLRDRLRPGRLDTLLTQALHNRGINLGYEFLVVDRREGGVVYQTAKAEEQDFVHSPHRVWLYSSLDGPARSALLLNFPNKTFFHFGSVGWLLLASVLFTGIILFSFGWTVWTILRQKKLSEMKNDFINNMTHEFKTPLATISLATDALKNPMVKGNEERMNYYTGIIKEENRRMNQQVERVLQIARSEIKLRPVELDAHQLIAKAVENTRLHVEQREGSIGLQLDAENSHIRADEVHLANLITNLLDNANKYSPDTPRITVSTWNEEGVLALAISDQGLGISRADQEKIFDRFYRVSTGNLHDVKGFGLGLSYVREIAEAHGGRITVKSKPGEGSTFIVRLPL